MIIAWNNQIDAATLTESSENANYPVENVQNNQLAKVWKTTNDASENLVFDLGAAASVTCAFLAGHNLTSAATVKVQGNATNSWGTPSVDETITWLSGVFYKTFTGGSYQYWRFTFADDANTDGYIEIGRLFLGTYINLATQFHNAVNLEEVDTSVSQISVTGQVFGDSGIVARRFPLQFPLISDANRLLIKAAYASVKKTKPIFAVLDTGNLDKLPAIYGVFEDPPTFQHIFNFNWTGSFNLREVF